jgi:hypothetical protein
MRDMGGGGYEPEYQPSYDEGLESYDPWESGSRFRKAEKTDESSVEYLGRKGEPGAYKFWYAAPNGDHVVGTNAPKGHQDHDELLGDPVVSPSEPNPEVAPQYFDEQGLKLDRPIPEGVNLESNPAYEQNPVSGNQWAKRYRDQDGGMKYLYYQKDINSNPKMERNVALRHVDVQLPKVRSWYKEKISENDPSSKVLGLFAALMDQAKISAKVLSSLKKKDVVFGDGNTVQISNGDSYRVVVSLDHNLASVLKMLVEGDREEPLFAVNGSPIDYVFFTRFLNDQFGILPSDIHAYQASEIFSKEFQKLLNSSELTHEGDIDDVEEQAMHNTAGILGYQGGAKKIEHIVDPIAREASHLGAVIGGKINKSYKLQGRTEFQGLPISIENKKGSVRHWHNPHDNTDGETKMSYDYGYIRLTQGTDGDHVDVYLGSNGNAPKAYVVHQRKAPDFKEFDEDKAMLGFDSAEEAKEAYLRQYDNPKFFGGMSVVPIEEFKEKVAETKNKPKMIKAHVWCVHSDVPEVGEEEALFGKWIHDYPVHEHHLHWDSYLKQRANEKSPTPGLGLHRTVTPMLEDASANGSFEGAGF